jgi:hypothetical protein
MATQTWSILIQGSPANFVPDVYSENPPTSTALQAQAADVVCWNNQTGEPHQLFLADEQLNNLGTALCDEIEPHKSSSPGYVTATADARPVPPATVVFPVTIYYICALHLGEDGEYLESGKIDLVA